MQILAPFSKKSEVEPLAEAGATEFFCGLVDQEWQKTYTYISSINLRHDSGANLSSFAELQESLQTAHSLGTKLFLALNKTFYSEKQLPIAMHCAEQAVKLGIDALIVADPGLIPKLKQEFSVKIVLSTSSPAFNTAAIDFFRGLGIDRIVLPRQLAINEIRLLSSYAKKRSLEVECFVLNEICPNIGGLCTFQHIVDQNLFMPAQALACRMPFSVEAKSDSSREKRLVASSHVKLWNNAPIADCGLCAIREIMRCGIDSLKIAGRGLSLETKAAGVRAVKEAIGLAAKGCSGNRFRQECGRLYSGMFHSKCDYKNCYYAEAGLLEN